MEVLETEPLCIVSLCSVPLSKLLLSRFTSLQPERDQGFLLDSHTHLCFQMKFNDKHITFLTEHVLAFIMLCDALRFPQRWQRCSLQVKCWLVPPEGIPHQSSVPGKAKPLLGLSRQTGSTAMSMRNMILLLYLVCYCQGGPIEAATKLCSGKLPADK